MINFTDTRANRMHPRMERLWMNQNRIQEQHRLHMHSDSRQPRRMMPMTQRYDLYKKFLLIKNYYKNIYTFFLFQIRASKSKCRSTFLFEFKRYDMLESFSSIVRKKRTAFCSNTRARNASSSSSTRSSATYSL